MKPNKKTKKVDVAKSMQNLESAYRPQRSAAPAKRTRKPEQVALTFVAIANTKGWMCTFTVAKDAAWRRNGDQLKRMAARRTADVLTDGGNVIVSAQSIQHEVVTYDCTLLQPVTFEKCGVA